MAGTSMTFVIALGLLGNLIRISHASEFINMPENAESSPIESVSEEDIRVSLLDEVESSLGKGSASKRLSEIETVLRPIAAALPKNIYGNLERSAVTYALHRLFVHRHGWKIKGLGAEAVRKNSSSPTHVLKDQVPTYIEGLFEKRLAGKGFRLQETALLAATIEHLIHNEAVSRIGTIFNFLGLSVTSPIHKDEATEVLDIYMMLYILGKDLNTMNLARAREITASMPDLFLAYNETQKFVDGLRKSTVKGAADFASLAAVVEAVGEQYGTFQDLECRQIKESLIKMEYRGTGRVRLADFYKPALSGRSAFLESSNYLRALGALDDSDSTQPSVMIANYIAAPTNCIASSGFYSICCKSECDALQGQLEEEIGAPDAEPASIASFISSMPSPTAAKLTTNLRQRLDDIAEHHGSKVPLHGRLFAQWMHHVYPRECPYPHISGATNSQLPEEWLEGDGLADQDEMELHVASPKPMKFRAVVGDLAVEDLMPWSHEEELVVVHAAGSSADSAGSSSRYLRSLFLLVAAGSAAFTLTQTLQGGLKSALGAASPRGDEKYLV